jgi:hypothetical protein
MLYLNPYFMEMHMIFDDNAETAMGIICFIPVVCFPACFIYYLRLIMPLTSGHPAVGSIVSIAAPVFVYCPVILARFKHLNAAMKTE